MALLVTIFSDFTCPFSYVTETALRKYAQRDGEVEVRYRAFELFPAPTELPSPAEEPGWEAAVRPLADRLELALMVPGFRPRTRKAHEAARFAAERGLEERMRDAIFRAYWADGRDIGRIDVLTALIQPLGVDPVDLKIALDIDQFEDTVANDLHTARRLHIPGAPTLFIGTGPGAAILVGAQTPEALATAMRGAPTSAN